MHNNVNNHNDRETVLRTMREVLLEASPAELSDALQEAGLNLTQFSKLGRSSINTALNRYKEECNQGDNYSALHKGLNSLLTMLRRRDNLDECELANKASVDEEEIRRIEYDPHYLPSPRTIFKLEKVFSLPSGVLAKLSGAIKANSLGMEERVMAFAANAKAIGKLTKEERALLNAFVKFLSEQE